MLKGATSPAALSNAILGLGKVSNGAIASATFVGGVDCAWLAAVAEWLFSLRVEVIDANGGCRYRKFDPASGDFFRAQWLRRLEIKFAGW